jgi:hypothetical protein
MMNTQESPERRALRARLLQEAAAMTAAGADLAVLIQWLHDEGLAIVESMWILTQVANLNLRDAKKAVTSHPAWQSFVEESEPLHDELEKALLADEDGPPAEKNGVKPLVIHGLKIPSIK